MGVLLFAVYIAACMLSVLVGYFIQEKKDERKGRKK